MHLLDDATDPWGIKVVSNNENVLTKILRLKELKLKMSAFLSACKELWPRKRKQGERQKPKLLLQKEKWTPQNVSKKRQTLFRAPHRLCNWGTNYTLSSKDLIKSVCKLLYHILFKIDCRVNCYFKDIFKLSQPLQLNETRLLFSRFQSIWWAIWWRNKKNLPHWNYFII